MLLGLIWIVQRMLVLLRRFAILTLTLLSLQYLLLRVAFWKQMGWVFVDVKSIQIRFDHCIVDCCERCNLWGLLRINHIRNCHLLLLLYDFFFLRLIHNHVCYCHCLVDLILSDSCLVHYAWEIIYRYLVIIAIVVWMNIAGEHVLKSCLLQLIQWGCHTDYLCNLIFHRANLILLLYFFNWELSICLKFLWLILYQRDICSF